MKSVEQKPPTKPQTTIMRIAEVAERVKLAHSTIYRLISLKLFPPPTKLGPAAVGWFEDEIDQWLEERRNAPNPHLGREPKRKRKAVKPAIIAVQERR